MEVGQTKKAPVAAGAFFSSHIAEVMLVLFFGGVVYCALEVLWRGRTHISMAICGGVCFLIMYELQRTEKYSALPLVLRALFGALIITAAELITGCIVNLGLGLEVWDYSRLPLSLWGQICLPFSLLWFLLGFIIHPVCDLLRRFVFGG